MQHSIQPRGKSPQSGVFHLRGEPKPWRLRLRRIPVAAARQAAAGTPDQNLDGFGYRGRGLLKSRGEAADPGFVAQQAATGLLGDRRPCFLRLGGLEHLDMLVADG